MSHPSHNEVVTSAIHQLHYNLQLYKNSLLQVNPHAANQSVLTGINSFNTILLHMISTRFSMARLIGLAEPNPIKELTDEEKNNPDYQLWLQWCADVTAKIEIKLRQMKAEELQATAKFNPPNGSNSVLGVVEFLLFHEAYHFGQLGILRKTMQLESLSFAAE